MTSTTAITAQECAAQLANIAGEAHTEVAGETVSVAPLDDAQISQILRFADANAISVTPFGSGTKAGWGNPEAPGIRLSLNRMNSLREHPWQDMTCTVEAGCTWASMQAELAQHGQMVALDPLWPERATVGGIVATNDSGALRLKYGGLRDLIIGMTIVLPDGTIAKTGGKVVKNVAGYDLHKLMTGSFGTLGVITEALLRLVTKPRFAQTALVEFASLADASRTVNAILSSGIVPATLELMDETAIACVEEAMQLGLPLDVEAILIVETDGSDEAGVLREIEAAARISLENGARRVKVAKDETERASLWKARRSVSPSLARKAPNKLGEDITVPRSAIPEAIRRLKAISAEYGLPIVIF